jgi:hypothetical protein
MLDSQPPRTSYDNRPGRWVAEERWPSPHIRDRTYRLAPGRLVTPGDPLPETPPLEIQSPLSLGLFAGKWCSYAAPPDLPGDQREEDGGALVFESAPLSEEMEILGPPVADLELSANRPVAMIAVRLSDVLPDGHITRVTYGLLNLTHRESHEHPSPLEPGERYRIRVQLNDIAQRFPQGHRIRISVSSSYWPLAWTPPERTQLTIYTDQCSVTLPVRPPKESDAQLRPFGPPESAPPERLAQLRPPEKGWRVIRDLATDRSALEVINDDGEYRIESIGLDVRSRVTETYTIRNDDVDSVAGETCCLREFRRKAWHVRTITRTRLTSDRDRFHIHASLDAYEGKERVFSKNWLTDIPRDLV